jgi:hypothetical protein
MELPSPASIAAVVGAAAAGAKGERSATESKKSPRFRSTEGCAPAAPEMR